MKTKKLQKKTKNIPAPKDFNQYIPSSQKYQLFPTVQQRKILNDWFSAVRKIWNVCLYHIKINKLEPQKLNEIELRNLFVINKRMPENIKSQLEWTLRTPKRVREYAIRDLLASYKSAETQLKNKQITSYIIKPKSKLLKKQNISVSSETSSIKNGMLCLGSGLNDIKMNEYIKDQKFSNNSRIIREGKDYFIYVPRFVEPEEKDCIVTDKIVSIDLGINIFGTFYNPDGAWGEIGLNVKDKLKEIYRKQDKISMNKRMTLQRKTKLIRKYDRKINNMIDDFHWKVIKWLLYNYKEILLSRLYVRRTCPELKRLFNDIKHCQFVDRLKYKCMFYNGRIIHEIKEHYTSSVCIKCGSMNITKTKTIKCKSCGSETHKDLSGSIAILMKYLC